MILRSIPKPHALYTLAIPGQQPGAMWAASNSATIRSAMERRAFGTRYLQRIREALFTLSARGGSTGVSGWDVGGVEFPDTGIDQTALDLAGLDWDAATEPFIHVRVEVRPRMQGEPERVLNYSDIDRPVGRKHREIQLDGRVLDLSYVARRLEADHGMARITCNIRLANNDRALDQLFRSPDWLRMRFDIRVGFRTISPRDYRRVGPVFRVDRVSAITSTHIELALIDATDGLLGWLEAVPSKAEVVGHLQRIFFPGEGLTVTPRHGFVDRDEVMAGSENPYAEVPFGGEWVRPFFVREWSTGANWEPGAVWAERHRAYCLGVTRNPAALTVGGVTAWSLRVADEPDHPLYVEGVDDWKLGIIREEPEGGSATAGGPELQDLRHHTVVLGHGVRDFPHPDDTGSTFSATITMHRFPYTVNHPVLGSHVTDWYAVLLTVNHATTESDNTAFPERSDWWDKVHIALHDGRLVARWPHGAEGEATIFNRNPWSGYHDPASIIQEIAHRYTRDGSTALLDPDSFDAVRKSYNGDAHLAGLHTVDDSEGSLYGLADTASLLREIAKSHKVDLFWGADGKLHIARPDAVSPWDLLHRVPGCPVYSDEADVIRDTWVENIPLGSERHGLTNRVNVSDLKWYAKPDLLRSKQLDLDYADIKGWERVVEGDASFKWIDAATTTTNNVTNMRINHLHAPNDQMANVVTFSAPLHALSLEIGDFFRITHYAGAMEDGGYNARLFVAEEVGLEWGSKQVRVSALDVSDVEARIPTVAVLDHSFAWERIMWNNAFEHTVQLVSGDVNIPLVGAKFETAGIEVGDLLLVDDDANDIHENLRIVEITGGLPDLAVYWKFDEVTDTANLVDTMGTLAPIPFVNNGDGKVAPKAGVIRNGSVGARRFGATSSGSLFTGPTWSDAQDFVDLMQGDLTIDFYYLIPDSAAAAGTWSVQFFGEGTDFDSEFTIIFDGITSGGIGAGQITVTWHVDGTPTAETWSTIVPQFAPYVWNHFFLRKTMVAGLANWTFSINGVEMGTTTGRPNFRSVAEFGTTPNCTVWLGGGSMPATIDDFRIYRVARDDTYRNTRAVLIDDRPHGLSRHGAHWIFSAEETVTAATHSIPDVVKGNTGTTTLTPTASTSGLSVMQSTPLGAFGIKSATTGQYWQRTSSRWIDLHESSSFAALCTVPSDGNGANVFSAYASATDAVMIGFTGGTPVTTITASIAGLSGLATVTATLATCGLAAGDWCVIGIDGVVSGGNLVAHLYVNGVLRGTSASISARTSQTTGATFRLLADRTGARYSGTLAQVAHWRRALDSTEWAQLADGALGPFTYGSDTSEEPDASGAGGGFGLVVDEAPTVSGTFAENWTIQRTRATAPTDAEFPGRYPLGSDVYLCAADTEEETFISGDAGQRVS